MSLSAAISRSLFKATTFDLVIGRIVGHYLKPTNGRELPTKKVTENPKLTDHFIIFYHSDKDGPFMFYFFQERFLFLLIHFLYFVSLFIKRRKATIFVIFSIQNNAPS